MKIEISLWQFVPPQEDEEPGMPTYRIAGLAEIAPNDKRPFCGDVSLEIDGRDAEYEPLWGFDLQENFDLWDALCPAMEAAPGWMEEHQRQADAADDV